MSKKSQLNLEETEKNVINFWEKEKIFKFSQNSKKPVYSIDTPPPTVSGKMHIGHAFSYAQQDFIARYKRMSNHNVFYPFGTDDNGLPTERLIEKLKNIKSKSMPRADFIKLCLKTLKEITPEFIQDWKNLGISCDYDIYYSTINPHSQKISQKSFIELYKKNQIYKENFPTIFCPECQTPIAQAELEDKAKTADFTTLKFKVDSEELPIATTRPELLGACVAVFINPKDKRYKHLVNKKATVPVFNHEVPVIADSSANIEKGTGVLMICSYGDKYDIDAIKRHKLTHKVILNSNGKLNIKPYENLSIKEARKKILEDLKSKNLVLKQKTIEHVVNTHDKCGTEIEFLPTEQWFIKILDKKSSLIAQGKKINWFPNHMFKRYENWISGLEWDWSISRERHFGIPIPLWHCKKCNEVILAKESELPVDPIKIKKTCPKCHSEAHPETKVLDTWATSSMTPQIASALANDKIKIPYSLRPQAHDIIRTWAFYTIIKSYLHESKIPWKDITISGFVTLEGKKMSKSKGNVITPQDVMVKYGSDALRYWAASSKLGEDLDYQEKDLITGKKFITKILNASRFVFMNLKDYDFKKPKKLEVVDELFLRELNRVIITTTNRFDTYEYSRAKFNIEEFFWKDFTDNYLEIVKKRVYNEKGDKKKSAQFVLYQSLLTVLKLIAPIMPFITEEIYQAHYKKHEKEKSIHISSWPKSKIKKEAIDLDSWKILKNIISKVRQEKTKKQKPMNSEIILTLEKDKIHVEPYLEDLKNVTNAREIKEGKFNVEFL